MRKVLIVPGLGDHTSYIKNATKNWPQKYGIEPRIYSFGWGDEVDEYDTKYQQFLETVRNLAKEDKIAVIGISAGASLVMNAALDLPENIDSVINICGRVMTGKQGMWSFSSFPLYWKSVTEIESKQTSKLPLLTIHPLFDEAVPVSQAITKGTKNKRILLAFHIPTILWVLRTRGKLIAKHVQKK